MSRTVRALAAAAVLLIAAVATAAKPPRVGLGVGYQPPPFTVTDLNGASQSLEAYRGKVIVLHFWATWCPYCRSEIPELTQLQTAWASKGVQVVTVSTDDDVDRLKRFVQQHQLPYPVIADASVADQYGVSGIPVTYVIDRSGLIATRLTGASEILDAVTRVLAAS